MVREAGISRDHGCERHSSFESHFLVEKTMRTNRRPPIAILLSLLGLLLAAYGTLADTSRYRQSFGLICILTPVIASLASGLVVLFGWRGFGVVPQKSISHSLESSGH